MPTAPRVDVWSPQSMVATNAEVGGHTKAVHNESVKVANGCCAASPTMAWTGDVPVSVRRFAPKTAVTDWSPLIPTEHRVPLPHNWPLQPVKLEKPEGFSCNSTVESVGN